MTGDDQLLRQFHETRSEQALAELLRRHSNLVYASALRRLGGDTHRAADVTQVVFATLTRNAGSLSRHTCLTAWLHTTTKHAVLDLLKKERRRTKTEAEAALLSMHNQDTDALSPKDLLQLRGLLDDLIEKLPHKDREALLLRHLQSEDFASIAQIQRSTPDAARMRVNRALSRLREALARRGIQSSSTALASALAAEAAVQAPASLAGGLTSTALASAPTLGAGLVFNTLILVNTGKWLGLGALSLAALLGTRLLLADRDKALETDLAQANHALTRLQAESKSLEQTNATLQTRLNEATADRLALEHKATELLTQPEYDDKVIEAKLVEARNLRKQGRYAEAFELDQWLLEKAMPSNPRFNRWRTSFLRQEMPELAANWAPAREWLLSQRNEILATKFLESTGARDRSLLGMLLAVNTSLGDQESSIKLYDALSPNDPLRAQVASEVFESLLSLQRYPDAYKGREISTILYDAEFLEKQLQKSKSEAQSQAALDKYAKTSTRDIEVLAGTGRLEESSSLLSRLIKYSLSSEQLAELQKALARAGHSELMQNAQR